MHVRQPPIRSVDAERQSLMVHPQQVQQRRVLIVAHRPRVAAWNENSSGCSRLQGLPGGAAGTKSGWEAGAAGAPPASRLRVFVYAIRHHCPQVVAVRPSVCLPRRAHFAHTSSSTITCALG